MVFEKFNRAGDERLPDEFDGIGGVLLEFKDIQIGEERFHVAIEGAFGAGDFSEDLERAALDVEISIGFEEFVEGDQVHIGEAELQVEAWCIGKRIELHMQRDVAASERS